MINDEYILNAIKTESNDFVGINNRLDHNVMVRVLHGSMGLCTESAELLDAVKKHIFYGKDLDITNVIEECGDMMWYLAVMYYALDIDPNIVMERNIAKLKMRYGEKFSAESAINRDLGKERQALEGDEQDG